MLDPLGKLVLGLIAIVFFLCSSYAPGYLWFPAPAWLDQNPETVSPPAREPIALQTLISMFAPTNRTEPSIIVQFTP